MSKLRMYGSAALLMLLAGCSKEPPPDPKAEAPPAAQIVPASATQTVAIDHPERFPVATAEARRAVQELAVTGSVAADVSRSVPVVSLSGGRVVDIRARLGDDVKKGQLLVRIQSADYTSALGDYQKAQADELLARKQAERSQALFEHEALARKDLEVAQDTEEKAKVDLKVAAEKIRVLGGTVDNTTGILDVRAPVSGTIVEQNVQQAAGVKSLDNSPNLFTIADLSRVWLLCDVYENNLAQVHLGDLVEVRLNAYPDKVLTGRVGNIAKVFDPATRTAKVRIELPNPVGMLRPGMFATATFRAQKGEQVPVVPASAVLRLHDRDWVFRPLGNRQYRREEVKAGAVMQDGMQQILSGIAPGDQVVKNALEMAGATEQ